MCCALAAHDRTLVQIGVTERTSLAQGTGRFRAAVASGGPAEPRFSLSDSCPQLLCMAFSSASPPWGDTVLQEVPGKQPSWQCPHQPLARCLLSVDQL